MDINKLTRKELLNLPQESHSVLTVNEVIITPTYCKHDSGFRLNAVIAPVKEEYKIIGYVDAVVLGPNLLILKSDVLLKSNAMRFFGPIFRLSIMGGVLNIKQEN